MMRLYRTLVSIGVVSVFLFIADMAYTDLNVQEQRDDSHRVINSTPFLKTLHQHMDSEMSPSFIEVSQEGYAIVPGQRLWSDTGLEIFSGQVVEIDATGEVKGCHGPQDDWAYGPWSPEGGIAPDPRHNSGRICALIGLIIGDHAYEEFFVGEHISFIAPINGRMFLGVSDIYHGDNEGEFIASIRINSEQIQLIQLDESQAQNLFLSSALNPILIEEKIAFDRVISLNSEYTEPVNNRIEIKDIMFIRSFEDLVAVIHADINGEDSFPWEISLQLLDDLKVPIRSCTHLVTQSKGWIPAKGIIVMNTGTIERPEIFDSFRLMLRPAFAESPLTGEKIIISGHWRMINPAYAKSADPVVVSLHVAIDSEPGKNQRAVLWRRAVMNAVPTISESEPEYSWIEPDTGKVWIPVSNLGGPSPFVFDACLPGEYRVSYKAQDRTNERETMYIRTSRVIALKGEQHEARITLTAEGNSILTIRTCDAASSESVPLSTGFFVGNDGLRIMYQTNEQGIVRFAQIKAGTYQIHNPHRSSWFYSLPDYCTDKDSWIISVNENSSQTLEIPLNIITVKNSQKGKFKLNSRIPINIRSKTVGADYMVRIQWVEFRNNKGRVYCTAHVEYASGPSTTWICTVELCDDTKNVLWHGIARLENSGIIDGWPTFEAKDLFISSETLPDITKISVFRIKIETVDSE